MESSSVSPERPVKITYKSRPKRKRQSEGASDSASEASDAERKNISSRKLTQTPAKKSSQMGPPVSTSSKKPEFKVPDTSFKRPRRDSDEVSVSSKGKTQVKSPSSISSSKRPSQSSPSSPSKKSISRVPVSGKKLHKPSSSISLKSSPHVPHAPSESEFDDGASIADSIATASKVRRTESERMEYFKNEPEASNLEPHSVTCLRCKKTVNLGKRQTYAVKPWEAHRVKCDAKVPKEMFNSNDSQPLPKTARNGSETQSVTSRTRTTAAERKAILEADPRAVSVKPDEVLCNRCKKWIRLSVNNSKYSLGNWESHQQRCGGVVPSSKVATAERKLKIVNDPLANSFGPRHVECAACQTTVILEGEAEYTLASWDQHKVECPQKPIAEESTTTAATASKSFPRPPPSVESSSTVVSPDAIENSPPQKGVKRRADEADLDEEEENLPLTNKPRTESYVPPTKEAPSALGWFLMPFRSFVRGFKESIS